MFTSLYKFLTVCFFLCFILQQASAQKPYNILWLSCEDIGPVLGAYGSEGIETPNIDRLAHEGVLFKNAYATVGVCAPSRASIITGMYPVSIGAQHMRTGNHWGFKTPEEESYKRIIKVKDKTGRNVPEYSVVPPAEVRCFSEYMREAGYYCTNNAKCDYQFNCPITAWDEVGSQAHYKNREQDQPFFAVFNHGVSHESQIWKRQNEPITVDTAQIHIPAYFANIPLVRRDVGRKYSNIETLDQEIGVWLKKLEDEDLLDNTIIFFWSDHGGPLLRQKRAVGNSGLQVPLIVRFPDKRMAGTEVKDIVSLMDLGPTVMSLAGIETPDHMQGQAFLGKHKAPTARSYNFGSADRFDEHTQMSRSVIDGRYVYIRNYLLNQPYTYPLFYREQIEMTQELIKMNTAGELQGDAQYIFQNSLPYEELYDLENDPDEVNNLAQSPEHKNKLIELRNALYQWQLAINDKGFIPEHDLVNMMWPGGVQPATLPVTYSKEGKNLALHSGTQGASIAYQMGANIGSDHWQLYSKPLKTKSGRIVARAVRIGYKTSDITSYTY
ncbi:sulfatase [Carboxylicivirga sp. M1479]|uniref:sulfatase family protein n=1 Tax=Carboxylicivirga sp. M1479 TaxID=2594476 RepID=UPI001178C1C9|nr:sulfatase [Carboxylicivirga sp. M1479]TRX71762.1 sulfatase [Carboxylicivirga sp. M1479]